ncbi:MAG: glycoside hydrolase family 15 protein [Burkholderiales bacterium]|nr:glycoside hydrolase family 15 protein [Burkholderiales bacterium]
MDEKEDRGNYRPIADYAAIGDCHGGALVSSDGRIDWCCLHRFDDDPIFCRLLDDSKGGFLSLQPLANFETTRAYLDGTNILRTEFRTTSGRVTVTDFMPVGRTPDARPHDYVSLNAPNWLVRKIEGLEGEVEIESVYRPSVAFAKRSAQLAATEGAILVKDGPALYSDMPFAITGDRAKATVKLSAGAVRFIVVAAKPAAVTHERIEELLAITTAFWREWLWYCRYDGPYAEAVKRSALALKLLTYAPTGATVAALTTSLPEQLGGERNWDYRYCWIRDASLMLYALAGLGYASEATQFYNFIGTASSQSFSDLQVLYGIGHESEVEEQRLDYLDGYARSRPVRCGNGASDQRQTDLYAYVMEGVLTFKTLGGKIADKERKMFGKLMEFMEHCWAEPDQGIWEIRAAPRHFVHSKATCWAAVDRAIRLFGEQDDWVALRGRILNETLAKGRGADGDHFCQTFSGDASDASLLLLPAMGFPADERILRRTLEAVETELRKDEFVWRYLSEDGLGGSEAPFLACSFWLVDALLFANRQGDAQALFETLLARANDVGLYAEQMDEKSGAFLGNFPQALTHLGLIGSAVNLELFAKGGVDALRGAYADRAKRYVGATIGWRGMLAALRRHPLKIKFLSSRRSRLI